MLCAKSFSPVPLFVTLWTVAHQAPLSMGFSRQEYWSELTCPPPGDLSNPGIEPMSPVFPSLQADSLPLSHLGSPSIAPYFTLTSSMGCFRRTAWLNCDLQHLPLILPLLSPIFPAQIAAGVTTPFGLGFWKSLGHLSLTCPSWKQGDPGHLLEPALQIW